MRIFFGVRNVYGQPKRYILDAKVAAAVSGLTGCATLRDQDVRNLRLLGHDVIFTTGAFDVRDEVAMAGEEDAR